MKKPRRGRPIKSPIRDKIEEIVDALGVTYGYEIFKVYTDAYEPIELRTIYYHLDKGSNLGLFGDVGIKVVKGTFTWGDMSIRKYYVLGPSAEKKAKDELHIIIKTLGLEYKDPNKYINWDEVLKEKHKEMKEQLGSLKGKEEQEKYQQKLASLIGWLEPYIDVGKLKSLQAPMKG